MKIAIENKTNIVTHANEKMSFDKVGRLTIGNILSSDLNIKNVTILDVETEVPDGALPPDFVEGCFTYIDGTFTMTEVGYQIIESGKKAEKKRKKEEKISSLKSQIVSIEIQITNRRLREALLTTDGAEWLNSKESEIEQIRQQIKEIEESEEIEQNQ